MYDLGAYRSHQDTVNTPSQQRRGATVLQVSDLRGDLAGLSRSHPRGVADPSSRVRSGAVGELREDPAQLARDRIGDRLRAVLGGQHVPGIGLDLEMCGERRAPMLCE